MFIFIFHYYFQMGFPGSSDGKESACNARDLGSIPVSGRSPGEGNGNPLQYSCLENPTDRGAWWATVHGVSRVGHDWVTNAFASLLIHDTKLVCLSCLSVHLTHSNTNTMNTIWGVLTLLCSPRNHDRPPQSSLHFCKVKLCPPLHWLPSPLTQPCHPPFSSVSECDCSRDLTEVESSSVCPFVTVLFHLT